MFNESDSFLAFADFRSRIKKSPMAGTPRSTSRKALELDRSVVQKPESHQTRKVPFPKHDITTAEQARSDLMEVMSRWNLNLERTVCCPFHGYAMQLKKSLRALSNERCLDDFPPKEVPPGCPKCRDAEEGIESVISTQV